MTYATEFSARIRAIEARAIKAGTSLTALCRTSGVARSTPDRWRRAIPKTVAAVTAIEAELERMERAQAKHASKSKT